MQIADPSGRLMRWRPRLSEFDFEIQYKKGKLNTHPDGLSRLMTTGGTTAPVEEEIPCFIADLSEEEDSLLGILDITTEEADDLLINEEMESDQAEQVVPITTEELLRS